VKRAIWFRNERRSQTYPNADGMFGYVPTKWFSPKKSTMFRDLYGVNSERSCVNVSVSYIREFPYVTSALSNGKQRRWAIVRGVRLQGTFSPSIATLLINVFLNLSREERGANPVLTDVMRTTRRNDYASCHGFISDWLVLWISPFI